MVENLYRFPDPEEFEDPHKLHKDNDPEKVDTATKKPSAPSTATNVKSKEKEKKAPSKLILTNTDNGEKKNFDKFTLPATF